MTELLWMLVIYYILNTLYILWSVFTISALQKIYRGLLGDLVKLEKEIDRVKNVAPNYKITTN